MAVWVNELVVEGRKERRQKRKMLTKYNYVIQTPK